MQSAREPASMRSIMRQHHHVRRSQYQCVLMPCCLRLRTFTAIGNKSGDAHHCRASLTCYRIQDFISCPTLVIREGLWYVLTDQASGVFCIFQPAAIKDAGRGTHEARTTTSDMPDESPDHLRLEMRCQCMNKSQLLSRVYRRTSRRVT